LAEDFQAAAVHQEDFNISELSALSNHQLYFTGS